MTQKRGFTLVELLVVIGIIALLISILLPSLARARQAAVTLQCLSNLRTIGQGFVLYQQDHNGGYPYGMRNNPGLGHWMAWPTIVSKYLGASDTGDLKPFNSAVNNSSMGVFICPAKVVEIGDPTDLHSTYVGHPVVLSTTDFFPNSSYYQSKTPPFNGKVAWNYKAVWMKNSSEKVVVMDGSQLLPDASGPNGWTWPVGVRLDTRADGLYNFSAAGATGMTEHAMSFDYSGAHYVANNNQDITNRNWTAPRYRHGGDTQCNYLFGDGHAETRSYNRATGKSDLTHANFSVPFPLAK